MNLRLKGDGTNKPVAILVIVISTYLRLANAVDEVVSFRADRYELPNGRSKRESAHGAGESSVWSHWSSWSACSRSCGGGAAYRTRNCVSRIPSAYMADMPPFCAGATHEYTSCNTQECPRGTTDFRATQCSVFNNKDPPVVWIPLASYGCELLCQTLDGLYMLNFGRALDGTECLTENNKQGMCIAAGCVKVGCDGVLNSDVKEDGCGICGGWNHTCGHVKEHFTDSLPSSGYYAYNSIATIPSGATSIRITDISGLNYLALRDEYDNFILNGDWVIEWPGEYQRAGTSINYQRHRNGTEIVMAPGPTATNLQIMIIFREQNPGVEYEYWFHPTIQRQQPLSLQAGALTENQIVGRHEFPSLTTTQSPKTTFKVTTTVPTTRAPVTRQKHKTTVSSMSSIQHYNHKPEKNNPEQGGERKPNRDRTKPQNAVRCSKCAKVRNRAKHFCSSDFVLHVDILEKRKEANDQTSYDVEIISTYKNTVHLGHREYLWVPNSCNCPRLKLGRQYVVTGNTRYFEQLGESKLVVDRDNLVNSWRDGLHSKWDKIQANRLSLCSTNTRTK